MRNRIPTQHNSQWEIGFMDKLTLEYKVEIANEVLKLLGSHNLTLAQSLYMLTRLAASVKELIDMLENGEISIEGILRDETP